MRSSKASSAALLRFSNSVTPDQTVLDTSPSVMALTAVGAA
jgi:hypothetical protein